MSSFRTPQCPKDMSWCLGSISGPGRTQVGAVRNENASLWRIYQVGYSYEKLSEESRQVSKEVVRLHCGKHLKD